MRICTVSYIFPNPDKPISGIYMKEQLAEIVRQGHEAHLVTIRKPHWKIPEEEIIEGIHVHRIVSNDFLFPIKCFFKLISLDKKYSFDVIHTHFVGYLTLMSGLAAKLRKKPFFVTAYGIGLDPNIASHFKKLLIRTIYNLSKKIINMSEYTRTISEHYASKKKQTVIPPGITLSKLKPTIEAKKFRTKHNLGNGIMLLSVGGLVWRKGHDAIISVLPDIVKRHPDLRYAIIGKGSQEQNLKKMAKGLGIGKNVIFWPNWVSDEELANFFNACDIFALMSRTKGIAVEGFGIVYVEASALGKPVIGGKGGGTSGSVDDGKSGFLVNPDDKEELKRKLLLLIENKKLREKMGNYGREYARKKHLWKYRIQEILKVYEEVVK
ncbi:glycosyltransferase family 4 protein [Candidatus Woesearchaeota archaeon]|nr:glycosyltransferase family 4 protein [Candidatus Woesearchaeota archaeon]